MTTVLAGQDRSTALYPPTVVPPERPLPLRQHLIRFVRNPLASLPRQVYEDDIVLYDNGRGIVAWVTGPALIEKVLLQANAQFPKTPLEKRVFHATLGEGILTSEGAAWRWQRRTAAPLFRPADLAGLVPDMTAAADDQVVRWRRAGQGAVAAIDRDMSQTTFQVISATMFAGSAHAEAAAIMRAADRALATVSWDIAAAMLRVPQWMWYPGKYRRRRAGRDLRAAVAAPTASSATTCWRGWRVRRTPRPARPCRRSSWSTTSSLSSSPATRPPPRRSPGASTCWRAHRNGSSASWPRSTRPWATTPSAPTTSIDSS